MKQLILLCLVIISCTLTAQEVVFSKDVKSDTLRPTKGPNLKKFSHQYLGISFPTYTNEELNYTQPFSSMVVDYGIRYKRRLNNTFAMGMDLSVNWAGYRIKQKEGKSVPDSAINKKEKFQVNSLTPALYFRINVGRRGNVIGNYLDLGAYGSLNWKTAHKTTNKNENDEMVRVSTSRLSYMENYSYGVLARIGINRLAISARYRLSDLFIASSGFPELPRLTAGIEFGLFKN
ncbi:MAG: outer membrane beta-barrel protein [Bacteroidales bacterium]|nr:outer membrane beta-barrel protein [Bacteroidales bacterium]